jgi:hypothetical protein
VTLKTKTGNTGCILLIGGNFKMEQNIIHLAMNHIEDEIEQVTDGLPTAVVEAFSEDGTPIVNYMGMNVYGLSNREHRIGEIVLVSGTSQVPAKYEKVKIDCINGHGHNAVDIDRIDPHKEKYLKVLNSAIQNLKDILAFQAN